MSVEGLRIPVRRLGVLIGPGGATRREIEERSGVLVHVDSESGEVTFDDARAFEPVLALQVREVVRAVGRGFPPEVAFRLFQDDTMLEVIDITEVVGKKPNHVARVRARLIGTHGKTRITIEEATGANMRVEGDTVSLLGQYHEIELAREAVGMILGGAPHSAVYRMLERRRKDLRLRDLGVR